MKKTLQEPDYCAIELTTPRWGDYYSILWSGLLKRDPQGNPTLQRTGPFCPPLGETAGGLWVTDSFRMDLVRAGVPESSFEPLPISKCVHLDWQSWGQGVEIEPGDFEPTVMPEEGDPANYFEFGEDDPALRASMEPVWSIVGPILLGVYRLEFNIDKVRRQIPCDHWMSPGKTDGELLFLGHPRGDLLISKQILDVVRRRLDEHDAVLIREVPYRLPR